MSWDVLYSNEFWVKWSERPPLQITLDWISGIEKAGAKRVYDLGCGLGRHTAILAKKGFDVTASDISPRARAATEKKLEKAGLAATVIDADMMTIPSPDRHFDAVLAIGVLEHNTRAGIEKAIREIRRALSPDGRILATFCPRNRWIPKDDPGHEMVEDNALQSYRPEEAIHHLVDEEELRELFADFEIHSIDLRKEELESCSSAELFISAQSCS